MPAIKVRFREFREQIKRFLESETPVAVTSRGEMLRVYVRTPRKTRQVETSELRDAADRLAAALIDTDEDEIVADFKQASDGRQLLSDACFGRQHSQPRHPWEERPGIHRKGRNNGRTAYRVGTDAIAAKVKQEFVTRQNAKKAQQPATKMAKKAA